MNLFEPAYVVFELRNARILIMSLKYYEYHCIECYEMLNSRSALEYRYNSMWTKCFRMVTCIHLYGR